MDKGRARPTDQDREPRRDQDREPRKDQGRESRWEKDAMTVEIAFALATGACLALLVFAATTALTQPKAGAILGGAAGVWRVVHVLRRFDRGRGLGR